MNNGSGAQPPSSRRFYDAQRARRSAFGREMEEQKRGTGPCAAVVQEKTPPYEYRPCANRVFGTTYCRSHEGRALAD